MPKTQLEKVWLAVGLAVAVVIAAVGYFFFIGPQRSNTSDVNVQVSSAQEQNDTLQARINSLDAQNRKLSTYKKALQRAELALPTTSELPDFLRSLQSLGNATLADVTTLSVGEPVVVGANPGTSSGDSGSTTSPDSPTTAPTAEPSAAAPTAPSGPQVYALPITAQVTGTVRQLTNFLGQLQSVQPRAVFVSSITMGADSASASSSTTLNVSLDAFVAPGSAAETAQLAQAATN